jgi:hypothetical protein
MQPQKPGGMNSDSASILKRLLELEFGKAFVDALDMEEEP